MKNLHQIFSKTCCIIVKSYHLFVLVWILILMSNIQTMALISSVTNKTILHTVFDVSSPQVGSIYIQRGITNRIEVKGSFIDLTHEIEIFGGGQRMLGTKISNSPLGASPAVLVFDFRSTTTGHHTVVLKRINGEDRFGMASALPPGITDIRYFAGTSQVALPAPVVLPRNTRIRMVVSGNNMDNLEYTPARNTVYNSPTPLVTTGNASSRTYEFITQNEGSLSVLPVHFKTKFPSTDKLSYTLFIGNNRWSDPTYNVRMATPPDLVFNGQPSNQFKLLGLTCAVPNTNPAKVVVSITNPVRCTNGTFNVPTPTQNNIETSAVVNWPNMVFAIKNNGDEASVGTTLKLSRNNITFATLQVPAIAGKSTSSVVYIRPKTQRRLIRVLNCAHCYDSPLNNDQNWVDGPFRAVLDPTSAASPNGVVLETGAGGEQNNTLDVP